MDTLCAYGLTCHDRKVSTAEQYELTMVWKLRILTSESYISRYTYWRKVLGSVRMS
jgi:hypothetical protein